MKKSFLQEIYEMNAIAGTQLTKEQEIELIKNRLQELEFATQAAADAYKKSHKVKPGTKITVKAKKDKPMMNKSQYKQYKKYVDYDFNRMMTQQFGKNWRKGPNREPNQH